jgi:hypothetical protein
MGEAALALANKFKSFPPDSLTFGTGNFAERAANCTYRNKECFLRAGERCWHEADMSRCRARVRF